MKIIFIENPKKINSKKVYNEITNFAKNGIESKQINLICGFVSSDKIIENVAKEFQIIKNRIYFNLKN